eukprot:2176733-Prorocentrum_lima.AAC.1
MCIRDSSNCGVEPSAPTFSLSTGCKPFGVVRETASGVSNGGVVLVEAAGEAVANSPATSETNASQLSW